MSGRLIVVTQAVDPAHPVLAATVPKLRALAARVDELVVLADTVVDWSLPDNARSRTFGAGSRAGRGLRLQAALAAELARRPAPVLVHMVPLFALLAAPLVRARRAPLLLWYTQWHASRTLRLAERVVTSILTADASSFPLASRKLKAIGHGIDVASFRCRDAAPGAGLDVLALGRYSSVKGYETVIRAVAAARATGVEATLRVHGPTLNEAERRERARLEGVVRDLGLEDVARLDGPVGPDAVRELLARADLLVSNTVPGAADKVVLEAAAACLPVAAPSVAFPGLLPEELRFEHGDADGLAACLVGFAALDPEERAQLGRSLREPVERNHSVESWADRVLDSARS